MLWPLDSAAVSLVGGVWRAFTGREELLSKKGPLGYGWGTFFAVGLGLVGLVGLVKSMLPVRTPVGMLAGSLLPLTMSVCAFVRRRPACYWIIVAGLTGSAVLNLAAVFLAFLLPLFGTPLGSWSIYLFLALLNLALGLLSLVWIAYFGNRRHMFGFPRGTLGTPS